MPLIYLLKSADAAETAEIKNIIQKEVKVRGLKRILKLFKKYESIELSLKKAMGNGLLKVRGPVWKVTVLADVFYRGRAIYPQILKDQGLSVKPDSG